MICYFQENTIEVEDLDKDEENRNQRFSLMGLGSESFIINETTGCLYIRETQLIDCEKQCDYNLTVRHVQFQIDFFILKARAVF